MLINEYFVKNTYSYKVENHSSSSKICTSISSILCFINFVLNDCICGYNHVCKLKKGNGFIKIDIRCLNYITVKKSFEFITNITNKKNELV